MSIEPGKKSGRLKILGIVIGFFFLLAIASMVSAMSSQKTVESDTIVANQVEQMQKQAHQTIGMPSIVNYNERRLVRMLYELRDDPEFRTYSYIVTMTGKFIKVCDSIGYGINASIQFSNPEKMVHGTGPNGRSAAFTKQAEPNGLFMPEGLAATYVMCVNPEKNTVEAVYVEPEVVVSPFPIGE